MNNKVLKEIFIVALLFMVIIFAIAILFYDCIPVKNEQYSSITYQEANDVQVALAEINTNSGDIVSNDGSVIKSYSVNSNQTDLADTEIVNGKKDPFANYSGKVDEEVVTTTSSAATVSNSQASNPSKVDEPKKENTIKNETIVSNNIAKDNSVVTSSVSNTVQNKETNSTTGTYFEKANSK